MDGISRRGFLALVLAGCGSSPQPSGQEEKTSHRADYLLATILRADADITGQHATIDFKIEPQTYLVQDYHVSHFDGGTYTAELVPSAPVQDYKFSYNRPIDMILPSLKDGSQFYVRARTMAVFPEDGVGALGTGDILLNR